MCNLIIDKGSCENIISTALVDYLELETKSHPHPYIIEKIMKGLYVKVMNLCQVPIPIGKFINIQLLAMLLIWMHDINHWDDHGQHDIDAANQAKRGQENFHEAYSITTEAKKSQSSYRYASEVNSWWNPRR